MLKTRLIPSLLVDSSQHLVKTIQFKKRHYLGEPLNSAYIFSGFEADELLVLDIDASPEGRAIPFSFVNALASYTSVPLTVGGGISKLSQIQKLLSFGVEKVVLSSKISGNLNLLEDASNQFGSSSISVILNVYNDSNDGQPKAYLGRPEQGLSQPIDSIAMDIQNAGAGELIVNNIDLEGTRRGFNVSLLKKLNEKLTIPLVALGGCGHLQHVEELLLATPINGIACGTFFVYGNEEQEVLLNYSPTAKWLKSNFNMLMDKWDK